MSDYEREPIEDVLRRLPLREPSAGLDERVRAACPLPGYLDRRAAVGAAVAAMAVLAAGLVWFHFHGMAGDDNNGGPNGRTMASVSPPGGAEVAESTLAAAPVRIEQVWSKVASTEVLARGNQPPVERVHQRVMRRVQWIDDQEHVRIQWSVPSEHTVLVPLDYN